MIQARDAYAQARAEPSGLGHASAALPRKIFIGRTDRGAANLMKIPEDGAMRRSPAGMSARRCRLVSPGWDARAAHATTAVQE